MANGYTSLHPLSVEVLKQLGVKSGQVTQGWGSAPASVGFHEPVGRAGGRKYGPCIDLTHSLSCPDFLQRLWEAGFAAFDRSGATGWSGAAHVHAIHLGLVDDAGKAHLPDGPRRQVVDFLKSPPINGMSGHTTRMKGYLPSAAVQAELRRQYAAWVPDYPTAVTFRGNQIACYAWLGPEGTVMAEITPFFRWWGCNVNGGGDVQIHGQYTDVSGRVFDGRFYRAPVRAMADLLGLSVKFAWAADKRSCRVALDYK